MVGPDREDTETAAHRYAKAEVSVMILFNGPTWQWPRQILVHIWGGICKLTHGFPTSEHGERKWNANDEYPRSSEGIYQVPRPEIWSQIVDYFDCSNLSQDLGSINL